MVGNHASGDRTTHGQINGPDLTLIAYVADGNLSRVSRLVPGGETGIIEPIAEYVHDALGRRVRRKVWPAEGGEGEGGDPTEYAWLWSPGWQLLEVRRIEPGEGGPGPTEVLETEFIHAGPTAYVDDHVALIDHDAGTSGESVYFMHADHMACSLALSDAGGAVVERYVIDPYGQPVVYDGDWTNPRGSSSYGNLFLHQGLSFDAESATYYNRNRQYHPGIGRLLQRDPMGYVDGANVYEYLGADPFYYIDPAGTDVWTFVAGLGWNPGKDVESAFHDEFSRQVHDRGHGVADSIASDASMGLVDGVGGFTFDETTRNEARQTSDTILEITDYAGGGKALLKGLQRGVRRGIRHVRPPRPKPSGVCFTAGTPILTVDGATPIEAICLGDRVLTDHQTSIPSDEFNDAGGEVHGASIEADKWRHVQLLMKNPDDSGDVIIVELLRPVGWVAELTGADKSHVELALPEMGLAGPAVVGTIGPCPKLKGGHGQPVIGRITHLNGEVLRLTFDDGHEAIEPTATHRLFSISRGRWTPAGELCVGEEVATLTGAATIRAMKHKPGVHRVYNLEIATDSCYYVGAGQVLVHNINPCGMPRANRLPRNPYGAKGARDHQQKIDELAKELEKRYPGKRILRGKKLKGKTGSNRRPDIQVVDPETGEPIKVIEVERYPQRKRNRDREKEYDELGLDHDTIDLETGRITNRP